MTQYWHFVNGESIQRDELEICGNPPNSLAKRRKICFFCPYQTKSYHTNGNGARIDKYKFYSCHNPTIFLITFNKHSSSHPRRDIYIFLLAQQMQWWIAAGFVFAYFTKFVMLLLQTQNFKTSNRRKRKRDVKVFILARAEHKTSAVGPFEKKKYGDFMSVLIRNWFLVIEKFQRKNFPVKLDCTRFHHYSVLSSRIGVLTHF